MVAVIFRKFPVALRYNVICLGFAKLSAPADGLGRYGAVQLIKSKPRGLVAFGVVPFIKQFFSDMGQCVALSVNAKRFYAENVELKSTQDTLFMAPFPDDLVEIMKKGIDFYNLLCYNVQESAIM